MPDDRQHTPLQKNTAGSGCPTAVAQRVAKRQRTSLFATPSTNENSDVDMDITAVAAAAAAAAADGHGDGADSEASSDWDDWADAMVAQGEPPGAAAASPATGDNDNGLTERDVQAEDEAWVRGMIEQGTLGSVVQAADSRAWDYVLQMAVEEEGRDAQQRCGEWSSGAITAPVREVKGAAATEFVVRWLRRNLPIALPALKTLELVACRGSRQQGGTSGAQGGCLLAGRAIVDSVAEPSAVAVVSRSKEQSMHRVTLFSLSANAGAALAAAVVQPGAAGLNAFSFSEGFDFGEGPRAEGAWCGESQGDVSKEGWGARERSGGGDDGCDCGVVFESLDSRILEEALVSTMGRLGLAVKCRSRSGMWSLPVGAALIAEDTSATHGSVSSLTYEDVEFIGNCLRSSGVPKENTKALVHGLINRNPSAGIRRGSRLVAWCMSFDNGLAGALHVVTPTRPSSSVNGEEGDLSLVAALVAALLGPPIAELPTTERSAAEVAETMGRSASAGGAGVGLPSVAAQSRNDCAVRGRLPGIVLDEDSPFVGLFRDLGLERVCDADWIRFEPAAVCGAPSVAGLGGSGESPVPMSALALHP